MKQIKGKRARKSFFQSKKVLIAAAMAALMAIVGITYAWQSWSVNLTGGTLKSDYVQVNAEFGTYIRITDLFYKYSFWFDGDNPFTPSNPMGSGKFIPKDPAFEIVLTSGGSTVPAGNEEFFIPFDYIQGDKIFGLKNYLETTIFEPQQDEYGYIPVSLEPLVGKNLAEVLKGVRAVDTNSNLYVPFFPILENYDPADAGLLNATYELAPLADIGNFSGLLESAFGNAAPGRDAASIINNWFQHEAPTSTVDVGYVIKNLGGACYINLPDLMKSVKISQSTNGAYYDAGVRYDSSFVRPTWGVAQSGNYVDGYYDANADGTYTADEKLSGWETSIPGGLYSNGMFEDPASNTYNAIYAVGVNKVPYQRGISDLIDTWPSFFGSPSQYGLTNDAISADYPDYAATWTGLDTVPDNYQGWVGFRDFYKAHPDFKFPIALINRIYAVSCNTEFQQAGITQETFLTGSGLYNQGMSLYPQFTGSKYFDIYPSTTSESQKWSWQDNADWKISISRSIAGGTDYDTDILTIAQKLWNGQTVQSIFDAADLGTLALISAGDFDWTYDGTTPPYSISQAATFLLGITGWDGTTGYTKIETKFIPQYDVAIAKDPMTGLQVLHIQGSAFTYKTAALAPSINLRYRLNYGAYLDNRFVGSEIYLDSKGVSAVQDIPEAALDAFVDKAGLNGVDISFFYGGSQWEPVALWDVKGLPQQYMDSIAGP